MNRAGLRAALETYAPTDPREQGYVRAMLDLLALPTDPCARDHFSPGHFTASAFVLSPDGEQVVLIHHRKLNRWLQPGGHVESTDVDIESAARREVAEETGLVDLVTELGLFDVDVHEIPARKNDPAHLHFDVRLSFRATTTEVRAGAGVRDVRWVALPDVDPHSSDASVARAVQKLIDRRSTTGRSLG